MNTRRILTASITALIALPSVSQAVDYNWTANLGSSNWNDVSNWDANGVPLTATGANIFIHTPGSITGVAIDANWMVLASGTLGAPTSGYTFGAGTYNVGTIHIGEGHHGSALNNSFGRAFINGGTVANVGSFHLGEWGGSGAEVVQSGGDLNISNQFRLGHWPQGGGAQNNYVMNGGTITMTAAAGDPLAEGAAGNVILGVDSSGTFNMNGGTFTAHGITMQTRGAGGGESRMIVNGGTLNIGVNGFVTSNPGDLASYDIRLGGGTVRSTANWNSSLEMHLIAGTGAILDSNGFNTTLSGNIDGAGSLTKNGAGTLALTGLTSFSGATTVNAGTLAVSGATGGGNGNLRGTVTVNSGAQLLATNNGGNAAFGYTGGAKVDVLNINGGYVESLGGDNHIWNATVNMTGGELRGNGGVSDAAGAAYQWTNTPLNTFASADTAVISGRINMRSDGSNKLIATVADGAAATDLRITAAVTNTGVSIYKLGAGHMEITGSTNSDSIRATGGTLTVSGSGTHNTSHIVVGETENLGGVVGQGEGRLDIVGNVIINTGGLHMGENWGGAFQTNVVNHSGGNVVVNGAGGEGVNMRIGHWPDNTSTYNLSGGTLTLVNAGMGIATDGTGIFHQTGGTLTAPQIVVNHRNGGGNATFTVQGGTANIGSGGIITTGGPAALNLGGLGGTLAASATWSSSMNATFSGNGVSAITFNTSGNDITMSGVLSGGGGLNKSGAGLLLLSGVNTYTGDTAVSAGTLRVGNTAALGTGGFAVTGGLLDLTGKGVTVSTHNTTSITLGGGAITLGVNGANSDRIASSGGISLSGNTTVNLANIGGIVPGTYTLLTGTGFSGAGSIALGSTPAGFYTWTPNQTATAYEVAVAGAATPAAAYWAGSVSGIWSDASVAPTSNWRTDAGGATDTNQLPGSTSDVYFATNTAANLTNTLGSNFSVQSINVTSATVGAVTIGGANAISLGAGGLSKAAGSGALTLNNDSLAVVAAQTWTNSNVSNDLTVNSAISGTDAITTAGAGTIVLGGNNNAYTGTLTVGSGSTKLAHANGAGATSGSLVVNGTLDLNGNSLTKNDLSGGASGIVTTTAAGALTVAATGGNFAGQLTDGAGVLSLSKTGGGTLTLTGTNTHTGGTTVTGGALVLGTGGTLGNGPVNVSANLVFAGAGSTINTDINFGGPAGTLFLLADGTTTLASGTDLKFSSIQAGISGIDNTLGGNLTIGAGASLTVQDSWSFGNTIGGGAEAHGIITQTGGQVDVNALNTDGRNFVLGHWSQGRGTYNLSGGTLNSLNVAMAVSWDGEGTFNLSGGTANLLGVRFGHSGGRAGVLNLTGGTLNLGSEGIWEQNAGSPSDINLGGGTIRAAANTVIDVVTEFTNTNGPTIFDTNGNTITINDTMSGSGGFTKTGAGRLVLNAANNATGIISVDGGTLALSGAHTANRIPANGLVLINSGATLEFASVNSASFSANYVIGDGGTVTSGAGVDHVHIGSVQMNGGVWTTEPGAVAYNGENYFLHGNVSVGGSTPSTITQQGGDNTNRGLAWMGNATFNVNDATGDSAADLIVHTELENGDSGSAALIKDGSGTMNLTNANSYSGGTIINDGTLRANNSSGSATGPGDITVGPGGTLAGVGTIGLGGTTNVTINGRLSPGNSAGTLTLNLGTGVLDIGAANFAGLEFELGTTSDLVALTTGGVNIGGGVLEFDDFLFTELSGFGSGDYVLFDTGTAIVGNLGAVTSGTIGSYTGTLDLADGGTNLILHVVPEPGSATLLLGGLALLAARRRRVE